jgi:hypothetical protein
MRSGHAVFDTKVLDLSLASCDKGSNILGKVNTRQPVPLSSNFEPALLRVIASLGPRPCWQDDFFRVALCPSVAFEMAAPSALASGDTSGTISNVKDGCDVSTGDVGVS